MRALKLLRWGLPVIALLLLAPVCAPWHALAQEPEDTPPAADEPAGEAEQPGEPAPAEEQPAPEAPPDQPPSQPPLDQPPAADEQPAEDEPPAQEEELPEGVRRRPPDTEEQERMYKQRKTREDPFLNVPEAAADAAPGTYNPADWLRYTVVSNISRYLVQDAAGAILGYSTIAVETRTDPTLGEYISLHRLDELTPQRETQLWLYSETLKPRRKEAVTSLPDGKPVPPPESNKGAAPAGVEIEDLNTNQIRLEVDYLFDRVSIYHRAGGITTTQKLRMLPYSYDLDQIPLLVRQLAFGEASWPFEAALCDPDRIVNLALAIAKPRLADSIYTAAGEVCDCYELAVNLGGQAETYWIERQAPRKLVKFTSQGKIYTLVDYVEQP